MDAYFSREIIDTSTVDTLANVQGIKATSVSSGSPSEGDSDKTVDEATAAATVGRSANGGAASGDANVGARPGQRALLRLRKKVEVEERVGARLEDGELPSRLEPSGDGGREGGM